MYYSVVKRESYGWPWQIQKFLARVQDLEGPSRLHSCGFPKTLPPRFCTRCHRSVRGIVSRDILVAGSENGWRNPHPCQKHYLVIFWHKPKQNHLEMTKVANTWRIQCYFGRKRCTKSAGGLGCLMAAAWSCRTSWRAEQIDMSCWTGSCFVWTSLTGLTEHEIIYLKDNLFFFWSDLFEEARIFDFKDIFLCIHFLTLAPVPPPHVAADLGVKSSVIGSTKPVRQITNQPSFSENSGDSPPPKGDISRSKNRHAAWSQDDSRNLRLWIRTHQRDGGQRQIAGRWLKISQTIGVVVLAVTWELWLDEVCFRLQVINPQVIPFL